MQFFVSLFEVKIPAQIYVTIFLSPQKTNKYTMTIFLSEYHVRISGKCKIHGNFSVTRKNVDEYDDRIFVSPIMTM